MFSFLRTPIYSPLPTNHPPSQRRRFPRWIGISILVLAFLTVTMWIGRRVLVGSLPYSPLKSYQHLNPPSIITNQPPPASSKRAVVSTLYSDSYAIGVAVLGHSVQRANVTARLLLPYLEGRVSQEALCVVRAAGWVPIPVPFIPPPHGGRGVHPRFKDQYTKLNIWGLDRLETSLGGPVERAVYLDADTLVRRNFDELFETNFNFAAVPDVYGDVRSFSITFNAGVLAYRPSSTVLETMKAKLEVATYPLQQAEQAFLNLFFGATALRLPYAYNANLAIKWKTPEMWRGIKEEIRIVHYTMTKPFTDDSQDQISAVQDENRVQQLINQAMWYNNGLFREEVGWWSEEYSSMMNEARGKIEACRHPR